MPLDKNGIDVSWPADEEVAKRHSAADVQPRTWSCFDLSTCTHEHLGMVYLGNLELCICTRCGTTKGKACTHIGQVEWNASETLLRCKLCGMDCT